MDFGGGVTHSDKFQLVSSKLKEGLPVFLSRAQHDGKTVRAIAIELSTRTGTKVSKSTVDRWLLKP